MRKEALMHFIPLFHCLLLLNTINTYLMEMMTKFYINS